MTAKDDLYSYLIFCLFHILAYCVSGHRLRYSCRIGLGTVCVDDMSAPHIINAHSICNNEYCTMRSMPFPPRISHEDWRSWDIKHTYCYLVHSYNCSFVHYIQREEVTREQIKSSTRCYVRNEWNFRSTEHIDWLNAASIQSLLCWP